MMDRERTEGGSCTRTRAGGADRSIWKDKKAAIFDMDGTLVDSMWMWTEIDEEYVDRFADKDQIDIPGIQKAIEGMSMHETAVYLKELLHIPDSPEKMQQDWIDMAKDKYLHEVSLKRGAGALLKEMKKAGLRLGIATSNSRELACAGLRSTGVLETFDYVLTAKEAGRGKPAPDIYLHVADRLGIDPADCIVFEDVPNGALAGRRAGMSVCGVADDYSKDRQGELQKIADYFVHDFTEIC